MSNHSSAALNQEYSPYVWTGGSGRLTRTHMHSDRPSWGLVHGADGGTEGHKKRSKEGGSEKEREMSFK